MTDFYQRLATRHPPRRALNYIVVIGSRPADAEYSRPDFWALRAFAGARPEHGIPVDVPIPHEGYELAWLAWKAGVMPELADAEPMWEAARRALGQREEK